MVLQSNDYGVTVLCTVESFVWCYSVRAMVLQRNGYGAPDMLGLEVSAVTVLLQCCHSGVTVVSQ
jgi:hypothetical protein